MYFPQLIISLDYFTDVKSYETSNMHNGRDTKPDMLLQEYNNSSIHVCSSADYVILLKDYPFVLSR